MANPYPTPSVFTYRVRQFAKNTFQTNLGLGLFLAEYSNNSGTTWNPCFDYAFGSAHDALGAISILVNNEANFAVQVNSGLAPIATTIPYPQGSTNPDDQ